GRYSLHGNIAAGTITPPIQPQPSTSSPQNQPEDEGNPVTSNSQIFDDAAAVFAPTGSWRKLTGVGYASDMQWTAAGSGAAATWTITGLAPGQYRLAATWTGSALNAVDASF